MILDQLATQDEGGNQGDQSAYVNLETPYMVDFVENFERKEEEKKQARKKKKGLENFVEDDK